jgi:hypothetical protein
MILQFSGDINWCEAVALIFALHIAETSQIFLANVISMLCFEEPMLMIFNTVGLDVYMTMLFSIHAVVHSLRNIKMTHKV